MWLPSRISCDRRRLPTVTRIGSFFRSFEGCWMRSREVVPQADGAIKALLAGEPPSTVAAYRADERSRESEVSESENKEVVRRFYTEVWDRGNVEVAFEVFAEGYV